MLLITGGSITIIDTPVIYDELRTQLSLEYLRSRHGLEKEHPTIDPQMIVVHWTTIPTLKGSFEAFNEPQLPGTRPDITTASQLNVGIHFLVDRDGTIYRLMPENAFARHVIGLNHCAIGIENVGGGRTAPLTPAQLQANEALIRYLHRKYEIEYLIGHYEYTRFQDHPLWRENDSTYRTEKTDPGEKFMRRLRKNMADLPIKGAPEPVSTVRQ
jgi:N-acetylmuramoyl-L-alanine amidase